MKHFIILLTLLFNLNLANAQDSLRYKEVDDFVKNLPLKVNTLNDLATLQREIKYKFKNDEDKLARAAFIWITNNIEYDCEGLKKGEEFYTYQLSDVLNKKKAVCAGYANLFQNFCNYFEMYCHTINGFAYNQNDTLPNDSTFRSNHAWNIVGVNKEWKIIDATWGCGWGIGNCSYFLKELKEDYFYANPEKIIETHFPEDSFWQLRAKPYTFNQFKKMIIEQKVIAKRIMEKVNVDSVISKQVGDTIRFYFITKNENDTITSISIDGENGSNVNVYDTISKNSNGYYYDFIIKKSGSYHIYVTFYNDMNIENAVSTKTEYYLFKISNRKSEMIKRPKKVIKSITKK